MIKEGKPAQSTCLTELGSDSITLSGVKQTFRKKTFTIVESGVFGSDETGSKSLLCHFGCCITSGK